MSFRIQVNTYGDPEGSWNGNAKIFDTAEEAETFVKDLFQRWTAVRLWRVIDQDDNVIVEGP